MSDKAGRHFPFRPAGVSRLFARRDATTELSISGTHVLAALMIVFCLGVPLVWAFLKYLAVRTIEMTGNLPENEAFASHPNSQELRTTEIARD